MEAGSTLGRLHREESKLKISTSKKNTNSGDSNHFYAKTHTLEAKEKMVNAKLSKSLSSEIKEKIRQSMTGKSFTDQHRMNLSLSKKNSIKVSVLDLLLEETTLYSSISQAEKILAFPKGCIRDNLKSVSGAPYRGRYQFTLIEKEG